MLVRDVLDYYMREHVRLRVADWRRQERARSLLDTWFGGVDHAALDSSHVNAYVDSRRRDGMSDGTLRRELNTLIAALNFAAADRRIPRAEVPTIRMPQRPTPRDLWLTESELEELLTSATSDRHLSRTAWKGWLFVMLAAETASRRRAIETLTWAQVDMPSSIIHFNPPGRAQNSKRRVSVPISDRLYPVLLEAKQSRTTDWVMGGPSSCMRGFKTVCESAYHKTLNATFLRLYPHALRRTWATQAARAGVDMYRIAGVMGNSIQVCAQNYLMHAPEHLRSAVNFRTLPS